MADYFSPTVIQQSIPITDMTPLERLVLSLIFDAEPDGEAVYFHTSLGPSDAIGLSIDELRAAFDASAGIDSTATTYSLRNGDGSTACARASSYACDCRWSACAPRSVLP